MTDFIRLAVVAGITASAAIGWRVAGTVGFAVGALVGISLLAARWNRLQPCGWAELLLRHRRVIDLTAPVTVANDRSGGGVRYQGGVAVAAVQILGRRHQPTYLTASNSAETGNSLDIVGLLPAMRQWLGLTVESLSVVSFGARRRSVGDYPRVYDTLIGAPPYAGQRETWLVIRIRACDNADALRFRITVGAAAIAAAQRIVMTLRCSGIRARVATATDITQLESRLGGGKIQARWGSVRGDAGWQSAYAYGPQELTTEGLAHAWSLRVDALAQNVTVFPDGTATGTVTITTPQRPEVLPAPNLRSLPGEQAKALTSNWCCPLPELQRAFRVPLPPSLVLPIGPSGVLLGRSAGGDRLLLPLGDPGEQCRVHLCADDAMVKRIVIRAAAAGERITVHSTDLARWRSVRMPNVSVIEHSRPVAGTTLSVIDGTMAPAPRPNIVVSVSSPGEPGQPDSDVLVEQVGSAGVRVTAAGGCDSLEFEFFRAEDRYVVNQAAESAFEPAEVY